MHWIAIPQLCINEILALMNMCMHQLWDCISLLVLERLLCGCLCCIYFYILHYILLRLFMTAYSSAFVLQGENLVVAVDDDGCFIEKITDFSGQYVKDADKNIIEALKVRIVLTFWYIM